MNVGDKVSISVPGSRFDGRTGTIIKIKSRRPNWRSRKVPKKDYWVRVDGDEGTSWGTRLPIFEAAELRRES